MRFNLVYKQGNQRGLGTFACVFSDIEHTGV